MSVAPSFTDMVSVGQAELQTRRPDLVVADGDVTQAMLHAAAAMADAVIRYGAMSFRDTFVDGASGDALTTLVDDHYNIQRQAATAAQVTLAFARTSGGAAGTILTGTTVATEFDAQGNEVRFTTNTDIVVPLANNGPFSVVATATVVGRAGNVVAGAVNRVIDQPVFDPTFTVSNAATAAGGNAEESDEDLRERARNFFLTLRRGTLASLEFGALQVPTVRVATASESLGIVTVLVSDSDGNSTAQMIADVVTEEENWRAAGITVNVFGGVQLSVAMTVNITNYRAGFNVTARTAELQDAIEARINKLKPGQTLYLDTIIATAIATFPDDIYNVTITAITLTPGGAQAIVDVAATVGQVIRAGAITIS